MFGSTSHNLSSSFCLILEFEGKRSKVESFTKFHNKMHGIVLTIDCDISMQAFRLCWVLKFIMSHKQSSSIVFNKLAKSLLLLCYYGNFQKVEESIIKNYMPIVSLALMYSVLIFWKLTIIHKEYSIVGQMPVVKHSFAWIKAQWKLCFLQSNLESSELLISASQLKWTFNLPQCENVVLSPNIFTINQINNNGARICYFYGKKAFNAGHSEFLFKCIFEKFCIFRLNSACKH